MGKYPRKVENGSPSNKEMTSEDKCQKFYEDFMSVYDLHAGLMEWGREIMGEMMAIDPYPPERRMVLRPSTAIVVWKPK